MCIDKDSNRFDKNFSLLYFKLILLPQIYTYIQKLHIYNDKRVGPQVLINLASALPKWNIDDTNTSIHNVHDMVWQILDINWSVRWKMETGRAVER